MQETALGSLEKQFLHPTLLAKPSFCFFPTLLCNFQANNHYRVPHAGNQYLLCPFYSCKNQDARSATGRLGVRGRRSVRTAHFPYQHPCFDHQTLLHSETISGKARRRALSAVLIFRAPYQCNLMSRLLIYHQAKSKIKGLELQVPFCLH